MPYYGASVKEFSNMQTTHSDPFLEELVSRGGQNPALCYQCGKCSAGCPVREFVSDSPNKIIRYTQLGMYEAALNNETIWACAGCMTCASRCPQEFNTARFMDALRQMALEKGYSEKDSDSQQFHKSFLSQIKRFGKTYELGMVAEYKLRTGHLMQDVDIAPAMLAKRKLGFIPHTIADTKVMKRIFERAETAEDDAVTEKGPQKE